MGNNGLLADWKNLEFKLTSSNTFLGSGPGTATYEHSAFAETDFVPNIVNVNPGINLEAGSVFDGTTGSWHVKYKGPGADTPLGYPVTGSGYLPSVTIQAFFVNVKLYCKLTGSLLRLVWDRVDIYVNGSFNTTIAGSGGEATSGGCGPNYIPLFGIPMAFGGAVDDGRIVDNPGYNCSDPNEGYPFTWENTSAGGPSGGWRYQEQDDSWHELPVTVYWADADAVAGCPFSLSTEGIASATTTYDAKINCYKFTSDLQEYVERNIATATVHVIGFDGAGDQVCDETYPNIPTSCFDNCTGESNVHYYRDIYRETRNSETQSATRSFRLLPDLTRIIKRMQPEYRALWFRGSFPQVSSSGGRTCADGTIEVLTDLSDTEVFPAYGSSVDPSSWVDGDGLPIGQVIGPGSEFLACVGDDPHIIEDPLSQIIYAPNGVSHGKAHSVTYTAKQPAFTCPCPPPGWGITPCAGLGVITFGFSCSIHFHNSYDNINQLETVSYGFPSSVGSNDGYQTHADPEARYCSIWGSPLWQYFLWREDWDADGGSELWSEYWGRIKEQWLYNGALPTIEQRRTRNSIIISPLEDDNGNTPFLDTFASGLRWLGVSRWTTDSQGLLSELTLNVDSPGEWIPTRCTPSFDSSGVVLTFTGGSPYIDLLMSSWTNAPFLLLNLSKQLQVVWDSGNVSSIKISTVSYDGTVTDLGTTQTTYDLSGKQHHYAGSWYRDSGAGVLTDIGLDTRTDGISSSVYSDPSGTLAAQLGSGKTFKAIRFTIVPVDLGSNVRLHWPRFVFENTHPQVWWENSKSSSWLWADGPGLRRGDWTFFDPFIGFMVPPEISGPETPSSIIDWLAFKRCVLAGVHPESGLIAGQSLPTELTTLYDTYEGQSEAVVDKFSLAPVLPSGTGGVIRAALINSFREVPPLACFPQRDRDPLTWLPTGDPAQVVYDWSQEPRYLISSAEGPGKLRDFSGTEIGTFLPDIDVASGWRVWKFSPVLDNNESLWQIYQGDIFAHVRPWHGWAWIQGTVSFTGKRPWNTYGRIPDYHRAYQSSEGIKIVHGGSVVKSLTSPDTVTSNVLDDGPVIVVTKTPEETLLIAYGENSSGDSLLRASTDDGRTFNTAMAIISNSRQAFVMVTDHPSYTVFAAFRYDTGTSGPGKIIMKLKGPGDLDYGAEIPVASSPGGSAISFADTGFSMVESPDRSNPWVLAATAAGSPDVQEWISNDDGASWTLVV